MFFRQLTFRMSAAAFTLSVTRKSRTRRLAEVLIIPDESNGSSLFCYWD